MGKTFEEQVTQAAQASLLSALQSPGVFAVDYENRWKIPPEWLAEVWSLVDTERLKKALALRLENELVDRIVNRIAEELSTDIKQILSVKERREALRSVARAHFDEIMRTGLPG